MVKSITVELLHQLVAKQVLLMLCAYVNGRDVFSVLKITA